MAKKKKKQGGVVIGSLLVLASMSALWKNETRFDYARAAASTSPVESIDSLANNQLFSYTDAMSQDLVLEGEYVDSFTGYLIIWRNAEIYAWDEDEDDDGNKSYNKEWMSYVDNNHRNSNIKQRLSGDVFLPDSYEVGPLNVKSDAIEFVDSSSQIEPNELAIRENWKSTGLGKRNGYLYLPKNQHSAGTELGDERVSYTGIPVPSQATYFGKFFGGSAVAYDDEKRDGWINQIIMDTGILHHIVAGDRSTALSTMKRHIQRVKWIVRGIASFALCFGFVFVFSGLVRFLFHIPVIGPIAETGAFALGFAVGIPIAAIVISASYLFAHPLLTVALVLFVGIVFYYLRQRGKSSQENLKQKLDLQYGHELQPLEMKELEFVELTHVALSDSNFGEAEQQFLHQWGKKHGWSESKCNELIQRAKEQRQGDTKSLSTDDHLLNLIKLALADGYVTAFEMRTIRSVARKAGYDEKGVREILDRVRELGQTAA